jgi:molybdopterin synthase catalytic subunit
MNMEEMRKRLKARAGGKAGMILLHNGIVRNTSRQGEGVSSIEVTADRGRLEEVMREAEGLPGVIAVEVEITEGPLSVGDDIMLLGIAGDIRENTLSAMAHVLDRIKKEVTFKTEHP